MAQKIVPLIIVAVLLFAAAMGTGACLHAGNNDGAAILAIISGMLLAGAIECGWKFLKVVPDGYVPVGTIPYDAVDRKWLDEIATLAVAIQSPPEWCSTQIERQMHNSRVEAQHRALINMINAALRTVGQRP